ncbi:hypothetical protein Sste5344_004688 [Sporothrix stenoceras]
MQIADRGLPATSINEPSSLYLNTSKPMPLRLKTATSSSVKTELAYPFFFNLAIRTRPTTDATKVGSTTKNERSVADSKDDEDDESKLHKLYIELFGPEPASDDSVVQFKGRREG